MSQRRGRYGNSNAPEMIYSLDQLEELVSAAKRMPMSRKAIVDEDEFVNLIEAVRSAIPVEIRDARRLLEERERLLTEAQEEALRIVTEAQQHASMLVSNHTILAEARQEAERLLRAAESQRQEAQGHMEVFLLQQLDTIRKAALTTMGNMESTVENSLAELDRAEGAISSPSDSR